MNAEDCADIEIKEREMISLAAREAVFMLISAYDELIQSDQYLGDALVECILPCFGLPMFAVAMSRCPPSEASMYSTERPEHTQ